MHKNGNLNILFIGGGKRFSAAEKFIEAGEKLGYKIKIFAYEIGHGLPIEKIASVIQGLRFSDPQILEHLKKVIKENDIKIAIPYHDQAVGLSALLNDVVFSPTSDFEICNTFFSKIKSSDYFKSIGIPVANFDGNVPAIAKPDKGSASKGIIILKEQTELANFLKDPEAKKYEVQKFISGQEYSVDGYIAINSSLNVFAPRKRLETLGGEAVRSITVNHEKIHHYCKIIAAQKGVQGAITIQFIEDSKTKEIFIMEVNPRFGGAMLTTWGAGIPWFEFVLCDFLKINQPSFEFQPNTLMVRSFREHFFKEYIHE